MTDHLVKAQEDLARKNRSLDVINQVAMAGNRQDDIHDVLYEILQNILRTMRLTTGWIYLRDPERNVFHLATWCGVDDRAISQFLGMLNDPPCHCQTELIQDNASGFVKISQCSRLESFNYLNVGKLHVTVPLIAREQHLGMINLLCDSNYVIPEEDLELLSSIGSQVSEIVSNAWLHLKLVEKEAARQVLLRSLVEAQEDERRRLARELHDGAGQTLTSLLVRLKTLENKTGSLPLQKDLQTMQTIVSDTIEQVRSLAHELRPAALEEFGLALALESLVKEISEQAGLDAACICDLEDAKIPNEIEAVLYRIAQEGATNVLRHAHATHLRLTVSCTSQGITMTIEDDGIGFDPGKLGTGDGKRHLGLISMKERAEILDGSLEVLTAPNLGTTIQVQIPVAQIRTTLN
jgi:signal transduction histidine kinase